MIKRMPHNKRITDEIERKFISEYCLGSTAKTIATKYGFKTNKTVLDVLKKHDVCRRSPKIQTHYKEDFFEKIDSKEKAYFLGLIITDGYIIRDYNGFGIQMSSVDNYVLRILLKSIGSANDMQTINMDAKRKLFPNTKDMSRLCVYSHKIAMDLKKLGVVRNKSKIIEYKKCVPAKFLSHFFRGLIDGDGTIGVHSKNKNIWCQLCSASRKFIYDLFNIRLPFKFSINKSVVFYGKNKEKKCRMYVLRVCGGNKKTLDFLRWLYNDKGDLYLRRKYGKVQNLIN